MKKKILRWLTIPLMAGMLMAVGCGNDASGDTTDQSVVEAEEDTGAESNAADKDEDAAQPDKKGDSMDQELSSNTDTEDKVEEADMKDKIAENNRPCPSESGALHVEGTQLVDEHGNPIQLKGLSSHGIGWFPEYINEDAMQEFHDDWNMNVFRLAMYTAEPGGYCTDGDPEQLKQVIDDGVAFATEADMYVIVDWHILSDCNPKDNQAEAEAFFEEVSAKYADHNNVLYEICNEPNGGTSWADIKAYAEDIIPIIRANDKDAVILVGTPNWSQFVDQAAADPITSDDNVMYTLHYYAATHKQDLQNTMVGAIEKGLPIFVSEYGICDASGNGILDIPEADRWMALLDEYNISSCMWNLSNKDESSAILKADATAIHGFEDADLNPSGQWLYAMLHGETMDMAADGADAAASGTGNTATIPADAIDLSQGDNLTVSATLRDSWNTNGENYYLYDLTIRNDSDKAMSTWTVEIPFDHDINLSDSWNGTYSCDGQNMTITPVDYNANLAPGAELTDVGFIVVEATIAK